MKTAQDFRRAAQNAMNGKTGTLILIAIVYMLISGVGAYCIGLIIAGPMMLGLAIVYLGVARKFNVSVETLFRGFDNFVKALVLYLLNTIFTVLWALLFIVPGIIKSISYSMSYYVLADNPGMDANEARRRSMEIMNGNKWRYFCLQCSFIGWYLLSICFTCGILLIWVIPYQQTANALFYEDLIYNQKYYGYGNRGNGTNGTAYTEGEAVYGTASEFSNSKDAFSSFAEDFNHSAKSEAFSSANTQGDVVVDIVDDIEIEIADEPQEDAPTVYDESNDLLTKNSSSDDKN